MAEIRRNQYNIAGGMSAVLAYSGRDEVAEIRLRPNPHTPYVAR